MRRPAPGGTVALCLLTALLVPWAVAGAQPAMLDPAVDAPGWPFSYPAKPSTALSIPGAPGATQVTWDGALYTGSMELLVVTGDPPGPVAIRVRQLAHDYLPLVHYGWQEGDIRYAVSAFAAMVLTGAQPEPVTFVRLQVRRMESSTRPAFIGFGLRRSGRDHRAAALEHGPVTTASRYEFTNGCAVLDGAAAVAMPESAPARTYAVAGTPYAGAFTAEQLAVTPETAVLLATWELGADEVRVDLKLPWTPLRPEAVAAPRALRQASYDDYAEALAEEWSRRLAQGMDLSFPEEKPLSAYAASVVSAMAAVERAPEAPTRLVHRLRAEPLSPIESATVIAALEAEGQAHLAGECLDALLGRQQPDGCLSPGGDVPGHCAVMIAACRHAAMARDAAWLAETLPRLDRAAQWVTEALLMPSASGASSPSEATRRLAAIAGLAVAAQVAEASGRTSSAEAHSRALDRIPALSTDEIAALPPAAIPSLLAAGDGFAAERNLPEGGLGGKAVTQLLQRLHQGYAEGVCTEGGLLDPAATAEIARLHLVRGEQEQALRDLYHSLVHTGSCHEGFVGGVRPWSDRDFGDRLTPDPASAATYARLIRDGLVREQGDELHLFSLLAPSWLAPGKTVGFKNASTAFGTVSAVLTASETGAEVELQADWQGPPRRIALHVPFFATVKRAGADQPGLREQEGPVSAAYEGPDLPAASPGGPNRWIEFRPEVTQVHLTWELKPPPGLSYEDLLAAWREQYSRRYEQHLAAGGQVLALAPIPLR